MNNVRTNITAQEWRYIVERIDERQEAGKSSLVTVRGFEVPQSRIKKQGKVHAYKTTLEKLAPSKLRRVGFYNDCLTIPQKYVLLRHPTSLCLHHLSGHLLRH